MEPVERDLIGLDGVYREGSICRESIHQDIFIPRFVVPRTHLCFGFEETGLSSALVHTSFPRFLVSNTSLLIYKNRTRNEAVAGISG